MQYNTVQCNATQHNYNKMEFGTIQYHATSCNAAQYKVMPCGAVQYDTQWNILPLYFPCNSSASLELHFLGLLCSALLRFVFVCIALRDVVLLVFFALIFSVLFCFALRCLALLCFALHDLCCVVLFLVSWLRITLRCFALLCLLCTGKYRGSAGGVRWKYWGSAGEVRGKYGGSTGEVQGKYGGSTRECGGRGDYAEEPRIPGNFGQQATKLLAQSK